MLYCPHALRLNLPTPFFQWHQEMLMNTSLCHLAGATHIHIEQGFRTACFTWEKVKDYVTAHGFITKQQEIRFYKKIKPCFTGYIECYTMLYASLIFKPESNEEITGYWRHELTRLERFKKAYAGIVSYLERDCTKFDEIYFTSANNDLHNVKHAKVYDVDSSFCSMYDYVCTGLIANKLFYEYIVQHLDNIN